LHSHLAAAPALGGTGSLQHLGDAATTRPETEVPMPTTHVNALSQGAVLFHHPVGRPKAPSENCLHVMDGDGASLCERVAAEDLIQVYELRWRDVPLSLRCPACRTMMQVYAAGSG
jgi:hypothetical protein